MIEANDLQAILLNVFTDIEILNDSNVELEFRLKKHYRNQALIDKFIHDYEQYIAASDAVQSETISYDETLIKDRNVVYRKRGDTVINKEQINSIDIMPFKLVLSIEHRVDQLPTSNNTETSHHVRRSIISQYHRIDITDNTRLEIELLRFDIGLIDTITSDLITILDYFDTVDINAYLPNFSFQKPITPFIHDLLDINKGFYITNKIDGVRRLLIIADKGVYDYDNDVRKIFDYGMNATDTPNAFYVIYNTSDTPQQHVIICDCEYYNGKYYCFDILYFDQDLRSHKYQTRLSFLDKLPKILKVSNMPKLADTCDTSAMHKPYPVHSVKHVNILLKKNIELIPSIADIDNYIKNINSFILLDGHILTYKSSKYYDDWVYKIKYEYKNTLDVLIKDKQCYQQDINSVSTIPNLIYDGKYQDGIVEVLLVRRSKQYYALCIRKRDDKCKPNFKYTINSIYSALHYGLNTDIFNNNSTLLLRRYHNSIKKKILAKCIHNSSDPTLIDIGSGNGADIGKWEGFKTITTIEASPSKIQVIKNRLKSNYSYLVYYLLLIYKIL